MSLLEVSGLTKRFGTNAAVDGLSFRIEKDRCMALLGPNGAGKTTTLRMLSGLLAPTSGSIRFLDKEQSDIRGAIGYLPQYPAFYSWMSGKEFLAFTAKLARMSGKEAALRTEELLDRVGLKDAAKRKIGGYSGGMKQRLGLAQAVIHRPKLLILDEPVSALDPQGRREVLDLLTEMKKETTILFSTHILHDVEEMSDDIIIMERGRIIVDGDLRQMIRDRQHSQITLRVGASSREWACGLHDRPYVRKLEILPDERIVLQVTELVESRRLLLQEIAELNIDIESFEVGRASLEDVFMKAVKG